MVIGYQGILGSNAWYASKKYIEEHQVGAKLLPLVSSRNVVAALLDGTIDIGVLAYQNSIAGIVEETKVAVHNIPLDCLSSFNIPIHHTLLVKPGTKAVKQIASHIQALKQTKGYREAHYPDALEIELPDTALASKMLQAGELPSDTAVISRVECANIYHLEILAECIEDFKNNQTEFHVVRLRRTYD